MPLPARVFCDPAWYAESAAVPDLAAPPDHEGNGRLRALMAAAVNGEQSLLARREVIDEYGWRNFGDLYADHETVFAHEAPASGPLVSHYNNQYDPIAGFCYQWLRSGNPAWWDHFCELAAHVVDIDIYHTNEDKSAYNKGLFWHTYHYVDAGRSTHRSYPRSGASNGGGPSNEHVYTTGLMLHYFVTGCTASKDAAVGLAQFIIDIHSFLSGFQAGNCQSLGFVPRSSSAVRKAAGRALLPRPVDSESSQPDDPDRGVGA